MAGPSEHLSWKELACKDGSPYPAEWRKDRAVELSKVFEMIRAATGNESIEVLSAYRSFLHNKHIGGAKNSQHLKGKALDLRPPIGYSIFQFFNLIKNLSKDSAIGGVGLYKTFIHVDIRPKPANGRIAIWHGAGMKDDFFKL